VQQLPNPRTAQSLRIERLFTKQVRENPALDELCTAVATCDASAEAPVVAFISKMVYLDAAQQVRRNCYCRQDYI
jgi:translation elongation factor EF-G